MMMEWYTNGLGSELPTVSTGIEIFTGDTCDFSIVEVACSPLYVFDNSVRRVQLDAGTNYIIKVFAESANVGSMVTLNVKLTPPPPSNDDCINAIIVDPLAGEILFGDTSGALVDEIDFIGTSVTAPGVWYKTTNTFTYPMYVTVSTCNDGTEYDTKLSIFSGDSCDSLSYFAENDDGDSGIFFCSSTTFLASGLTSFYILVHGFASATGKFSLSINGSPNFISLIDSKTDSDIQIINDLDLVDYVTLSSATLNIQATVANAQSVRVTFDKPRRSVCEKKAPYSIFGDNNGDYFGATIPIGIHTVTATPYSTANCKGTIVGPILSKTFEVSGCYISYLWEEIASNSYTEFYEGDEVPSCNMNIQVDPVCGFDNGFVEMQIHDAITKELMLSHREVDAPYYLFGNVYDIVNSGSLDPGEYTIKVNIDGIKHLAMTFFVAESDDSCD